MATAELPQTGGDGLREARKAAGLKQREVAQAAGCSVPFVSMAENGYRPSSPVVLARVAEAVGASYGSFWAVA